MNSSILEVIFRLLPETCFINYCIMMLSNQKFDKKCYLKSCLIIVLCGYIIRYLPISYGIHIILNMISFAVISIIINKYDVVETMRSIVIVFVIMMIVEGLNMLIMTLILQENISNILVSGGIDKILLGIPSLISYAVISVVLHFRGKKLHLI